MAIMDPYFDELLACPAPPDYLFSADGAMNPDITTEQLDEYLRAIGALPPLPPAGDSPPTPPEMAPCDTATRNFKKSAMPYDAEVDANLRALEKDPKERPSPDYIDTTPRGRMDRMARATLVLWISEFTDHYSLGRAALHRAVSYTDRFLSARPLSDDTSYDRQLRLLGAAAAYTAAKYEDRTTASKLKARDIASGCGFAASQEVIDTERAMMAALEYRLGGPTANTFVDHFTRHGDLELLRHKAHGVADSSLFDHRCVKLLPSAVAAAAILMAMMVLKPSYDDEQVRRWSREIEELTGYRPLELKDGLDAMHALMLDCYPPFEISPLFFVEDP